MPIINDMGTAILWLIRIGIGVRAIILLIKIMYEETSENTYKNRLKKMVAFYILAESIYQIAAIVRRYFVPSSGNIYEISQFISNILS